MADEKLVELLLDDLEKWNAARQTDLKGRVDLRGANLSQAQLATANLNFADLQEADLSGAELGAAVFLEAKAVGANFRGATLDEAHIVEADFRKADLSACRLVKTSFIKTEMVAVRLADSNMTEAFIDKCCLIEADLAGTNLHKADLGESSFWAAKLIGADLREIQGHRTEFRSADLTDAKLNNAELFEAVLTASTLCGADLSGANLIGASLVRSKVTGARFTGCQIYGVSAWDLDGQPADESDLIVTPDGEPDLMVEDLDVAQFMYLLLHNPKIRDVIDTVTTKVVLILGRFSGHRKEVLDAIRTRLKQLGYVPVIFDFDRPANRNLTETVLTLANLSRFVVADISEAKSIPQELATIVPALPSVPIVPILAAGTGKYAMFDDFYDRGGDTILDIVEYDSLDDLLSKIPDKVIQPAEDVALQKIERRLRRQQRRQQRRK